LASRLNSNNFESSKCPKKKMILGKINALYNKNENVKLKLDKTKIDFKIKYSFLYKPHIRKEFME
jgi:hypothetical protein